MSGLTGDWNKIFETLNTMRLQYALLQTAEKAGNYGASEVKKGIQSGSPGGKDFQKLHSFTVGRKGSSKPLIDKGDLIGSITYIVKDRDNVAIGVKTGEAGKIAAVHEFGCTIAVTPKMRAYLHGIGLHLRASTTHINIPPRPFLRPVLMSDKFQKKIGELYFQALREVFR